MFFNIPEQICQKNSEIDQGGKWGSSAVFSGIHGLDTIETGCPTNCESNGGWGGMRQGQK